MKQKVSLNLFTSSYDDGNDKHLVESMLKKDFGFELSIRNSKERVFHLLDKEDILKLREDIDKALVDLEYALKFQWSKTIY